VGPRRVHEREAARLAEVDIALELVQLAGRACGVGAAVRQPDPRAQPGFEDGLVLVALDLAADRLDGDGGRAHGDTPGGARGAGRAATRVRMTSLCGTRSSVSVWSSRGSKTSPWRVQARGADGSWSGSPSMKGRNTWSRKSAQVIARGARNITGEQNHIVSSTRTVTSWSSP